MAVKRMLDAAEPIEPDDLDDELDNLDDDDLLDDDEDESSDEDEDGVGLARLDHRPALFPGQTVLDVSVVQVEVVAGVVTVGVDREAGHDRPVDVKHLGVILLPIRQDARMRAIEGLAVEADDLPSFGLEVRKLRQRGSDGLHHHRRRREPSVAA